eukprot:tig00020553_g10635.t1
MADASRDAPAAAAAPEAATDSRRPSGAHGGVDGPAGGGRRPSGGTVAPGADGGRRPSGGTVATGADGGESLARRLEQEIAARKLAEETAQRAERWIITERRVRQQVEEEYAKKIAALEAQVFRSLRSEEVLREASELEEELDALRALKAGVGSLEEIKVMWDQHKSGGTALEREREELARQRDDLERREEALAENMKRTEMALSKRYEDREAQRFREADELARRAIEQGLRKSEERVARLSSELETESSARRDAEMEANGMRQRALAAEQREQAAVLALNELRSQLAILESQRASAVELQRLRDEVEISRVRSELELRVKYMEANRSRLEDEIGRMRAELQLARHDSARKSDQVKVLAEQITQLTRRVDGERIGLAQDLNRLLDAVREDGDAPLIKSRSRRERMVSPQMEPHPASNNLQPQHLPNIIGSAPARLRHGQLPA